MFNYSVIVFVVLLLLVPLVVLFSSFIAEDNINKKHNEKGGES